MNKKFKYLIDCCGLLLASCSSEDTVQDVEFNESGAEASSVIWSDWFGDAGPGENPTIEPVKVTFDRPFLFFITERQTGACLMAGKIAQL